MRFGLKWRLGSRLQGVRNARRKDEEFNAHEIWRCARSAQVASVSQKIFNRRLRRSGPERRHCHEIRGRRVGLNHDLGGPYGGCASWTTAASPLGTSTGSFSPSEV